MGFKCRTILVGLALLLGLSQIAQGSWIYLKAELAQWLLQDAWERSVETGLANKPWPWADTTPLMRLQIARLSVDTIVLQGDHGQALAFGPGHTSASALPGRTGTALVSGHRDTHFAFMRDLHVGDRLGVNLINGEQLAYQITELVVVDADEVELNANEGNRLLLATCWPFDSPAPGGSLRFLAVAEPVFSSVYVKKRPDIPAKEGIQL